MKIVGDDTVDKYLLLSHAHDGSLAVQCGTTPIRVVCNNTLSMALTQGSKKLFKARHTQNMNMKLEQIRETIAQANEAFEKVAESYRLLARRHVDEAKVKEYVTNVMSFGNGKLSTKASNIVDAILSRVYSGIGQDMSEVQGTLWQAYNGVTEYLSHERGHNQDSRINALWFGDSAEKNDTALELALELAA